MYDSLGVGDVNLLSILCFTLSFYFLHQIYMPVIIKYKFLSYTSSGIILVLIIIIFMQSRIARFSPRKTLNISDKRVRDHHACT